MPDMRLRRPHTITIADGESLSSAADLGGGVATGVEWFTGLDGSTDGLGFRVSSHAGDDPVAADFKILKNRGSRYIIPIDPSAPGAEPLEPVVMASWRHVKIEALDAGEAIAQASGDDLILISRLL